MSEISSRTTEGFRDRFDLNAKLLFTALGSSLGVFGLVAGLVAGHVIDRFIEGRLEAVSPDEEKKSDREASDREETCTGMSREEAMEILGVPATAKPGEIRSAYRRLAAEFHPDLSAGLEEYRRRQLTEAFLKIRSAYDRLQGGKKTNGTQDR